MRLADPEKLGQHVIVLCHVRMRAYDSETIAAFERFVQDQAEDMEMPPVAKRGKLPALTADETANLRAWINQGANWPEGVILDAPHR